MVLQAAHEEFIICSIEHFFYDLPADKDALITKIKEFSNIFIEGFQLPFTEAPRAMRDGEPEEQYQLYLCLANPDQKLPGLENQDRDKNITIKDVLKFIYYHFMDQLLETLKSIDPQFDYNDLPAEFHSSYEVCAAYSNPKLFVTTTSAQNYSAGSYAWSWEDELSFSDKIYKPEIYFIPNENEATHVSLKLSLQVNSEKLLLVTIEKFIKIPTDLASDYDQQVFQHSSKTLALWHTQKIAKDYVWDFIPDEGMDKIVLDLPGLDLITHRFYLNLLQTDKIKISDLCQLSNETSHLLMSSSIISLIDHDICDFFGALGIQPHQHKLLEIPFYLGQVLQEKSIQNIIQLSETQCQTLVLPPITNLLSKGIIDFDLAKSIDPLTKEILCSQVYLERVEQGKISLHWLLSPNINKQILLQENIISLLALDKISIEQAVNDSLQTLLNNSSIDKLLRHDALTASRLTELGPLALRLIQDHPATFHIIMRDNTNISAKKLRFFITRLTEIFAAINSIYEQHGIIDIIQRQHEAIAAIKTRLRSLLQAIPSLREDDLKVFLIKEFISKILVVLFSQKDKVFFKEREQIDMAIIDILTLEKKEKSVDIINQAWIKTFDDTIRLLPHQVTRSASPGFFTSSALQKISKQKISLLATLMAELNDFNQEERPHKKRRIAQVV